MKKGLLITLDGIDGSGKKTQINRLYEKLIYFGYRVYAADFPQYNRLSSGAIIKYLNGAYGELNSVSPYITSIFYAIDRYDASFKIKNWLNEGAIILINRYVNSNLAHQGAKISDPLERRAFTNWVIGLEYKLFKIPRPDLNIILDLPATIAENLVLKKTPRNYIINGRKDIHELDSLYLEKTREIYLEIGSRQPNTIIINCSPENRLLTISEIHDKIWNKVAKII